MFGIGPTELIIILAIALLVLGPKRLPELARSLGKGLAEFRRATADVTDELDNARILLEEEAREAAKKTDTFSRGNDTRNTTAQAENKGVAGNIEEDDDADDDDDDDEKTGN
jgi:TatA/E family protein of Tat protein translocase